MYVHTYAHSKNRSLIQSLMPLAITDEGFKGKDSGEWSQATGSIKTHNRGHKNNKNNCSEVQLALNWFTMQEFSKVGGYTEDHKIVGWALVWNNTVPSTRVLFLTLTLILWSHKTSPRTWTRMRATSQWGLTCRNDHFGVTLVDS